MDRETRNALRRLQRIRTEVREARTEAQERIAQIRRDPNLSPEGRTAAIESARVDRGGRLEALAEEARELRDEIHISSEEAEAGLGPVDENIRSHVRSLLSGVTEPARILQVAIQERDLPRIRALRAEIPWWAEGQREQGLEGVETVDVSAFVRSVQSAEIELLPAEVADARKAYIDAEGVVTAIHLETEMTEEVAGGGSGLGQAVGLHYADSGSGGGSDET